MARRGSAWAAESPLEPSEDSQLRLGPQRRVAPNRVAVALEITPAKDAKVREMRAEILLPPGPWRFRKAEAPEGSGLKISVRQRREEQTASPGEKRASTVLALVISGGKAELTAGQAGELSFSLDGPETALPIPLQIRKLESFSAESKSADELPPLKPPTMNPPANPVPTCFFFTH